MNAAVCIDWGGDLHALLDELLAIERDLGRVRRERWGPRTIDLDILFSEGAPVSTARLVVPHPHLHERAFALLPLRDVMPEAFGAGLTLPGASTEVRATTFSLL